MVISSWHALNSRQQFCIYYKLIFTARSEIANPQESVDVGINPLKNQDSFIDWLKDFKPYDGYQTALKFAQIFQNSINVPKSFCYKVEFLTPFLSPIKSILVFNSSHNFLKILAPSRSPGLGRNIPDLLLAPPPLRAWIYHILYDYLNKLKSYKLFLLPTSIQSTRNTANYNSFRYSSPTLLNCEC